ncbi:MAG TPA: MaoC family dehydratase [Thermoanaerobaculia bacterium]|nr:MaoC family dehydratase [Thermoanaerobaculia bacterium]
MTSHLPGPFVHTPVAFNYASASSNKIHDDATARRLGFAGALVPGVASYGYLTHSAVEALGEDWCSRGSASIRLASPVYEGDRVSARAAWAPGLEGRKVVLELLDGSGALCAEGWAALDWPDDAGDPLGVPEPASYPRSTLPEPEGRPQASLETLRAGNVLGSLSIGPWPREELPRIAEQYRDPSPRYAADAADAAEGALHPAHLLHAANQILVRNALLGPWIHLASSVRHVKPVDVERRHEMRGRVAEATARRGHEIVTLDLALFDDDERPVTAIRHTAIIRPRSLLRGVPA